VNREAYLEENQIAKSKEQKHNVKIKKIPLTEVRRQNTEDGR
jgi:hypothetical protein